jgi:hypothetical protein
MHYYKPSWHGESAPEFVEFWYTWGQRDLLGQNAMLADVEMDETTDPGPTPGVPTAAAAPSEAMAPEASSTTRKRAQPSPTMETTKRAASSKKKKKRR